MENTELCPLKMEPELEVQFNKVYAYFRPICSDWQLDPDMMFTHPHPDQGDPTLMELKGDLNKVKNQLSKYDIEKWHTHTCHENTAGQIMGKIKATYYPQLCTQAWCKFFDILCSFPVFNQFKTIDQLNSLHLCEAPGAFISSLNHYLNCHQNFNNWNWRAQTLNPYYEGNPGSRMIADDRLIACTLDNWYFGEDNTGDIMEPGNQANLAAGFSEKFHLITSDGSIDCAKSPAEQEAITHQLHYCEMVVALQHLALGGTYIMKVFTLFEHESIALTFVLCCLFERVFLYKPCCSKPGNSETYFVCLNFQGASDAVLGRLAAQITHESSATTLYPCFPENFIRQHREACGRFSHFQMNTILRNIDIYENGRSEPEEMLSIRKRLMGSFFVKKCQPGYLPKRRRFYLEPGVVDKSWIKGSKGSFTQGRRAAGTYFERTEEVTHMQLLSIEIGTDILPMPKFRLSVPHIDPFTVQPLIGRKIKSLQSSKFTSYTSLATYHKFLKVNNGRFDPSVYRGMVEEVVDIIAVDPVVAGDGALYCALKDFLSNKPSPAEKVNSDQNKVKEMVVRCLEIDNSLSEKDLLADTSIWKQYVEVLLEANARSSVLVPLWLPLTRLAAGLLFLSAGMFQSIYFVHSKTGQPIILMLAHRLKFNWKIGMQKSLENVLVKWNNISKCPKDTFSKAEDVEAALNQVDEADGNGRVASMLSSQCTVPKLPDSQSTIKSPPNLSDSHQSGISDDGIYHIPSENEMKDIGLSKNVPNSPNSQFSEQRPKLELSSTPSVTLESTLDRYSAQPEHSLPDDVPDIQGQNRNFISEKVLYEHDILEVLPIQVICQSAFYKHLCALNEYILTNRMKKIQDSLREVNKED